MPRWSSTATIEPAQSSMRGTNGAGSEYPKPGVSMAIDRIRCVASGPSAASNWRADIGD